jgi:Fe-S-cluster-containing dehydrogenase component
MATNINRRHFIRGSLAAAGAAAAASAVPKNVRAAAYPSASNELCTMLDLSKCIGCEECVYACQEVSAKYQPPLDLQKPFPKMFPPKVPVEDWSDDAANTEQLTPYNWLYIQRIWAEKDGGEFELNIPRRCMHCLNPPCASLCPFGAAHKQTNGITVIDPDICLGGAKCRTVCPWHIPQRQTGVGIYTKIAPMFAGNGVMYKCNRCYERIEEGKLPACIEVCPVNVQIIGPRDEIVAKAHARAKEIGGYVYGEHENGGTNTLYVSPVPFDQINEKLKEEIKYVITDKVEDAQERYRNQGRNKGRGEGKGRGGSPDQAKMAKIKKRTIRREKLSRPLMGPVENTMAATENMTAALVIGPIAGAALAAGQVRKIWKSKGQDKE